MTESILDRLMRRRLFRLAIVCLYLLYGAAICAPLIANDRPYVLEAVDLEAYDRSRRTLLLAVSGVHGLAGQSPEGYRSRRPTESTQSYEAAVEAEVEALTRAVRTMQRYLPRERHAPLDDHLRALDAVATWTLAGDAERALARAEELREEARELRADYAAGAEELRPVRSYPLFASLSGAEVFFIVLWAAALPAFLGRRAGHRAVSIPLALALATGGVWWLLTAVDTTSFYPDYKARLDKGTLVAKRVFLPPIPFGFAEQTSESWRPPTWRGDAEIDERGHYVRGPRRPVPDASGVAPQASPVKVRFSEPDRNSPWRHPLGTDRLGRDMLVRAFYGGRVSLSVGLASTLVLAVIGILLGAVAGYFGGRIDLLISRVIEVVICFPVFFLILCVVAFVGNDLLTIMIVIGLFRWTTMARLTRAEFLRLKQLDFVQAARALGLSTPRIVLRHVLPNAVAPLLVAASFSVGAGILIESGLSFLGFGVNEPIPSWGSLVQASRSPEHWWIQLFPGLLIFVTVACYNLVGDAVRDVLDPRMEA